MAEILQGKQGSFQGGDDDQVPFDPHAGHGDNGTDRNGIDASQEGKTDKDHRNKYTAEGCKIEPCAVIAEIEKFVNDLQLPTL